MKTKTHFAFRVDIWDDGDSIVVQAKNMDRWNLRCSASVQQGTGNLALGSNAGRALLESLNSIVYVGCGGSGPSSPRYGMDRLSAELGKTAAFPWSSPGGGHMIFHDKL